MEHAVRLRRWLAVLAIGLAGFGCVSERSPVTGERQYYGYSWEQELELGEQADDQISQQLGHYDDEAVQAYVDAVAQRVLAESDFRAADTPERYRNTEFTFRVLDSPVINAFALPGGYVYVTRGLLAHMQNEAQLAVVLGHEIAHVAARHASRQALRAQFSQIGLLAGAIIGQQVLGQPGVAENILNLGGAGLQLLLTKYSRDAERESDRLGVRYAAQEGYQVGEAAGFFRTLERLGEQHGTIPSWQSTHPDPGERAETILEMAAERQQPRDLAVVGQDELYAHLEGLVVGDDPRQGYQADDAFFHPELEFRFSVPREWELANQRAAVIMAAPDRQAMLGLTLAPAETPEQAAAKLAATEGLQVISRSATTVNGLDAYRLTAVAASQQGEVALINYFIAYGGNVYSFLGYAPRQRFESYAPAFTATIESFARLEDPDRLDVEPTRLAIVAAPREATFRSLLEEPLPEGFEPEDVALMNQVELDDRIPAGQPLKIPR